MPETITVHHRIPLAEKGAGLMVFQRWLPTAPEDAIVRSDTSFTTTLYFDYSCQGGLTRVAPEEIVRWHNIFIACALVDVVVADVADELVAFIRDEHEAPQHIHHGASPSEPGYVELSARYVELGVEVQKRAIEIIDRVLGFARNAKGQYWPPPVRFDNNFVSSRNVQFGSSVSSSTISRRRWCPLAQDMITLQSESPVRFLTQADWPSLRAFALSAKRPDLMFELLANAEALARDGRNRNALIESISALEVAVAHFTKRPHADALTQAISERVDTNALGAQAEHIGFSGTVRYLLPVLFSEAQVPTSVFKTASEAIDARNTLVHGRRRDIHASNVATWLPSIRNLCERLIAMTDTSE